jgi:alpha-galactosidase
MPHQSPFVTLESRAVSIIIDCQHKTPALLYWGAKLSRQTSAEMIKLLATRQEAKCSVVVEAPISLSPVMGEGFTGSPGIEIMNQNNAWSVAGKLQKITQSNGQNVVFETVDDIRKIKIIHELNLDDQTSVLAAKTTLVNLHDTDTVTVNSCAAPTLKLPDHVQKIMSFEGRWSNEFQRNTVDLFLGSFVRENRKGKTSHDNFPGFLVHHEHTNEQSGECYGFHLGWSGNHKMRVELLPEGRVYAQLGELLMPGELELKPQQSYVSPTLYACYSNQGFSKLSQQYHQFVRENILSSALKTKARPVHYNTWEGLYFDHDVDTLKLLAEKASALGAERFVLDDGWFKGRRGDKAGLGDWIVDKTVYPEGLAGLIEHVNNCDMEFGLWFEPEMVNPDSDLYRAHPDWVLQTEGNEQLRFRNQLVLDFSRKEVTEYLYHAINDILTEYPNIVYIKWDMNRDINHAGNYLGKPAIHQQTLQFYALVDRLKAQHPHVEIESCSSGGARVDYGVLAHTDRVWTSDSNDALDRLSIQRGCSFFFPAEVMGAHVGPRDCHITGRRVDLTMRAAVAFFGHMGIEMDPRELTELEAEQLKNIIALHKKHRALIHSGNLVRIDSDGDSINFGLIDEAQTKALFAYNSVLETKRTTPPKFRFVGLAAEKTYKLSLVWPTDLKEYSRSVLSAIQDQHFSGEALMNYGMQLPVLFPQTSLIFELTAVA